MTVGLVGVGPVTYSWTVTDPQTGGTHAIVDGPNVNSAGTTLFVASGASTSTLQVQPVPGTVWSFPAWTGFRCIVTNACGTITSNPATLTICVADTDDGTATGTCDGGVTIDDLLYYLRIFEDGAIAADIDDGSSTGTPDSGVTIDDLLYYLFRFEAGC